MTACFIDSGLDHVNFLNCDISQFKKLGKQSSDTIKVWWDN